MVHVVDSGVVEIFTTGTTGWINFSVEEATTAVDFLHFENKGNNKITELRTILQRESQNSQLYKQTKSVNNRKTVKTVMTLTW